MTADNVQSELSKELPRLSPCLRGLETPERAEALRRVGDHVLHYGFLSANEKKVVEKLVKIYQRRITVAFILTLDPEEFVSRRRVGSIYLKHLVDLQDHLLSELSNAHPSSLSGPILRRRLFVPTRVEFFPILVLALMLREDFESLLCHAEFRVREIALARWGYRQPQQSLEELSERFGMTREGIRLREMEFNRMIPHFLRIHPRVIRANVRPLLETDLLAGFHAFALHFASADLFYSFLEQCCGWEKGRIRNSQWPGRNPLNPRSLEEFFAITPFPISVDRIREEISGQSGFQGRKVDWCMDSLEKTGCIQIVGNQVKPMNLTKKTAVAHVLAGYPTGASWREIAGIVNREGLSRARLSETRLEHAFVECEHIYLCAQGAYRHVRFLDLTGIDADGVLQVLRKFLRSCNLFSANLQFIHHLLEPELVSIIIFCVIWPLHSERRKGSASSENPMSIQSASIPRDRSFLWRMRYWMCCGMSLVV